MVNNYNEFAEKVIQNLGGQNNIKSFDHCVTRLRFELNNESKVNIDILNKTEGIIAVRHSGDEYQLVVGDNVLDLYKAVYKTLDKKVNSKKTFGQKAMDLFSNAFHSKPTTTSADSLKVEKTELSSTKNNKEILLAPIQGKVIPLADVLDEAFSSGALGKGVAIDPADGKVFSPFDGEVTVLFPTGHAVGILSEKGCEVLIHIGMDTVKLDGKGFMPKIDTGTKVKKGDLLIEFDIEAIKEAGLSTITPIVITNFDDYLDIVPTSKSNVEIGDKLINIL